MPTPSSAAFSFAHEATTNRLLGCWAGPVTEADLRTHYTDLLAAASTHGNCCFWLLDLRRRNWSSPEFGRWFGDVYAAMVYAAWGQLVFVACVLSAEHRAAANTDAVHTSQRACMAHGFYTFFFDSEAPAHEWLAHQQAHDVR